MSEDVDIKRYFEIYFFLIVCSNYIKDNYIFTYNDKIFSLSQQDADEIIKRCDDYSEYIDEAIKFLENYEVIFVSLSLSQYQSIDFITGIIINLYQIYRYNYPREKILLKIIYLNLSIS